MDSETARLWKLSVLLSLVSTTWVIFNFWPLPDRHSVYTKKHTLPRLKTKSCPVSAPSVKSPCFYIAVPLTELFPWRSGIPEGLCSSLPFSHWTPDVTTQSHNLIILRSSPSSWSSSVHQYVKLSHITCTRTVWPQWPHLKVSSITALVLEVAFSSTGPDWRNIV